MNKELKSAIAQFSPHAIRVAIDKQSLEEALETVFSVMFPVSTNGFEGGHKKLEEVAEVLITNIAKLTSNDKAEVAVTTFFGALPSILDRLVCDADAYLKFDPAAKSVEEVLITYPGFFALAVYRLAHELHQSNIPIIPRLFTEYAHAKVGIDIHPGAKIGKNFFMDHGTGIVIGETTEIGDNVKVYQGVTLGALYLEKNLSDVKRHPTVEDNVIIYSGATILGGDTVIGRNSIIGGSAWLTHSVPPNSFVYNKVDVKVRQIGGEV